MAYDTKMMVNKGMRSGMKPKMAIASALAKKRKYAMGGEVEPEMEQPVYPADDDSVGLSDSVMEESELVKNLQAEKYSANDNSVEYTTEHPTMGSKMNESGVEQSEEPNVEVGNKPELEWIDDGTAEPMSSIPAKPSASYSDREPSGAGLSEEAKAALRAKKMNRRFKA